MGWGEGEGGEGERGRRGGGWSGGGLGLLAQAVALLFENDIGAVAYDTYTILHKYCKTRDSPQQASKNAACYRLILSERAFRQREQSNLCSWLSRPQDEGMINRRRVRVLSSSVTRGFRQQCRTC